MTGANIPNLIERLRFAQSQAKRYEAKVANPHNPNAKYDREERDFYFGRREDLIAQLDEVMTTGISAPFASGVDREAQIAAFLDQNAKPIAAE